jgi:hypothetical protein
MRLKAAVKYLGAMAHYMVFRKKAGIYEAKLQQYEGSSDTKPPEEILMVKGLGHWSGDIEDKDLTDKIGYCLEEDSRKGDIINNQ